MSTDEDRLDAGLRELWVAFVDEAPGATTPRDHALMNGHFAAFAIAAAEIALLNDDFLEAADFYGEAADRAAVASEDLVGPFEEFGPDEHGGGDQTDLPEYIEGVRIIDCGDRGEIVDVNEDGETIYTVEFEDGDTMEYPASEIELGIVDGTIRVRPPEADA